MIVNLENAAGQYDTLLRDYTQLTDVALRQSLEVEYGVFIAESANVIERAILAGYTPRSFLMSERWLPKIEPVIAQASRCLGDKHGGPIPVFLAPEKEIEQLTGFHLHRGAIAAMARKPLPSVPEILDSARQGQGAKRIALLDGLVDHTNVGAVFRSAAALEIDAVIVTSNCADPLYRRAVRVSMGGVFQVPWTRLEHWPYLYGKKANKLAKAQLKLSSGIDILRAAGFKTVALALTDQSYKLDEFSQSDICMNADTKIALVLGSEGYGLPERTVQACDYCVKIPMRAEVDSINVSVAAALAFWELRVRN